MPRCPHCDHVQSAPFTVCPACGADAGETLDATTRDGETLDGTTLDDTAPAGEVELGATAPSTPPPARGSGSPGRPLRSSRHPAAEERFPSGTLLADRYRIRSRLGAGAMGEVYLAEDLTLDQDVALKFLPAAFGQDERIRQRFLQEVRLARQIAHPNVCRVYDVGEVEGDLFLSMEYVTGRDLATVLRSVGRFPEEKALDVARQLCAGLAALHDRGVLHRDLKPANVMLDDDGRLRITDFGLAGVASEIVAADVRSGTPLYMAPEQLAGREVSERSDIYALGLVLYEIFSGRRAYSAETLDQLRDLQSSGTPSRLSDHVERIDPAVERVVSRCLDPEPARRPPSAMVVATALPGGDPLAAALAMGETPSAELVAAAGGTGGLRPVLGLSLLAIALVGLALVAGLGPRRNLLQYVDMDRSADALEERARQLVDDLGLDPDPVDRFRAFARAGDQLAWLARQDSSATRWDTLGEIQPSPVLFWYRQSPTWLLPRNATANVTLDDPPPVIAGMVEVVTDVHGRLVFLEAVPPESPPDRPGADDDHGMSGAAGDSARLAAPATVWERLFAAAHLDPATFAPTAPNWIPAVYADERHAWTGTLETAGHTIPLVVHAGAVAGRPVYFRVHGPWFEDARTEHARTGASGVELVMVLLVLAVLATGVTLALRNHRRGRTDLRGAGRLAAVLLTMPVLRWLFALHHAPRPDALLDRFFTSAAIGALYAVMCLLLYLALEPFARRIWPQVMIGWTRLLSGGWRDPMVGRSLLVGGAMAGVMAIVGAIQRGLADQLGMPPTWPQSVDFYALATPRALIGDLAMQVPNSLFNTLFFLMLLVLLRLLLRRTWLTWIAFVPLVSLFMVAGSGDWRMGLVVGPVAGVVWLVTLVRGGLLAFATGFLLWNVIQRFPLTLAFDQAYATTSLALLAGIIALLAFAFSTALGGRSLLEDDVASLPRETGGGGTDRV